MGFPPAAWRKPWQPIEPVDLPHQEMRKKPWQNDEQLGK